MYCVSGLAWNNSLFFAWLISVHQYTEAISTTLFFSWLESKRNSDIGQKLKAAHKSPSRSFPFPLLAVPGRRPSREHFWGDQWTNDEKNARTNGELGNNCVDSFRTYYAKILMSTGFAFYVFLFRIYDLWLVLRERFCTGLADRVNEFSPPRATRWKEGSKFERATSKERCEEEGEMGRRKIGRGRNRRRSLGIKN